MGHERADMRTEPRDQGERWRDGGPSERRSAVRGCNTIQGLSIVKGGQTRSLVGRRAYRWLHYRFTGHRFLEGISAEAVDARHATTLAKAIAEALTAIHAISENDARTAGVILSDPEEQGRKDWLEQGLALTAALDVSMPGSRPR